MIPNDLTFSFFSAIVMVSFLVPFIFGQWRLFYLRRELTNAFGTLKVREQLLVPRSRFFNQLKVLAFSIAWTLFIIALMGPIGHFRLREMPDVSQTTSIASHELVLIIDASASMGVPDGTGKETRFDEAKAILQDLVEQQQATTISLYAFTSVLTPIVPPTLDYLFLRLAIKDLQINEGDAEGTNIEKSLKSLYEKIIPLAGQKTYSIVLLSDGGDSDSSLFKLPKSEMIYLDVIGIGSSVPHVIPNVSQNGEEVRSKLEESFLRRLAQEGHGTFYLAEGISGWELAQSITEKMKRENKGVSETLSNKKILQLNDKNVIYDFYYQIPLGIALLFYGLAWLLPTTRRS